MDQAARLPGQPARNVAELDVLRGVAAALMVVNHLGVALLGEGGAEGMAGAAVFLGSFAPVLFFFATGFGAGLSMRQERFQARLYKALLLIVADQFLFWRHGVLAGLDFFGFIGVSLLAVWAVQRFRRPGLIALAAVVALLAMRFLLAPRLGEALDAMGPVGWMFGRGVQNVSYPATPWLVYPLLGVAMGLAFRRLPSVSVRIWSALLLAALLGLLLAGVLLRLGFPFFRWGTVSLGYFVLSLSVLVAAIAGSAMVQRMSQGAGAAIALTGPASFAVVPIHYAIGAMAASLLGPVSPIGFALVTVVAVPLSLVLARQFAAVAATYEPLARAPVWLLWSAVAVLGASCFAAAQTHPFLAQLASSAGQLVMVLLFSRRLLGALPASAHGRPAG